MGHIHITLAVHWEGRHLDGVKHLVEARTRLLPGIPMTHFVSAAYFARGGNIEEIIEAMLPAFDRNDELALHVPAWQSLRGSTRGPEHTVIVGDDPELVVEYPGITAQVDHGYTYPISTYGKAAIEAFIVTSKLLLRPLMQALLVRRKLQIERILRGIRAGHGMASDVFLAAACNTGFTYDASGMDSVWARMAANRAQADAERGVELFAPLWRHWAELWGDTSQTETYLSNQGMQTGTGGAGVNASTQPFFIARCGSARLLELPVNGGVVPPANPQHVAGLVTHALESPPGIPRILSFAIRQETAEGSLEALLSAEALRSSKIQWATHVDLLARLLGEDAVPESAHSSPLQELRAQIAKQSPLSASPVVPATAPAMPVAAPVQIPPIQIPQLKT